jgi:hypothetical protein
LTASAGGASFPDVDLNSALFAIVPPVGREAIKQAECHCRKPVPWPMRNFFYLSSLRKMLDTITVVGIIGESTRCLSGRIML